ncbi:unnamed protein product [Toxocara canis]|uniref:MIR domain-containing protein n=1 Tax=Toxocara canis TaxID=6265 RepID=A0A183VGH4_TOXCA|nr:unnamed protein product [Toxocara canis]
MSLKASGFYYIPLQFGTLALPDGTYLIEPVEERYASGQLNGGRSRWSHKAHLVYKSRSHSFHSYDYSTSASDSDSDSSRASATANLLPDETHFATAHINASLGDQLFAQPDDWIDINC